MIMVLSTFYVHVLLDGRDVAPQCAQGYLKDLEAYMAELNCGKLLL